MAVRRDDRLKKELNTRFYRACPMALTAAGMVVVTRAQRIFVLFRPRGVATGHTWRSITVGPPEKIGGGLRVKVGPTTAYSWWLHFGRQPGRMPPIDAILDWVSEKHIAGTYTRTGPGGGYPRYGRVGTRATRQAEDLDAAWAIAKSIAAKGTRPFPFLTVALRQSRSEALRVFRRTLISGMALDG